MAQGSGETGPDVLQSLLMDWAFSPWHFVGTGCPITHIPIPIITNPSILTPIPAPSTPPHPGAEHSWGCSHQFASPVRGRGSGLVIHTVYLLGSGVLQTTGEGGGGGRETSNGFITGKKHGSVGSALQLSWGMWCGALWAGAGAWPGPHCCCPPSSSTAVLLLPGVGAGPKGDRGAVGAEGRKGP